MSEYQDCMTKAMQGFPKGISKEQRGLLFCANAKVCSGKAKTIEEAQKICKENPPVPKVRKPRKGKLQLVSAQCLVNKLRENFDSINDITEKGLQGLIAECRIEATKIEATKIPTTRNAFMKQCMKSSPPAANVKENSKHYSACMKRWKEQKANV